MGFHKMYITNSQIIELYSASGICAVKNWYETNNALVVESGLAQDIYDLIYLPDLTQTQIWDAISTMIMDTQDYE